MNTQEIAHYVQERLLDGGYIVQRYDSYSTNSIYLKLDYGVMNSIRISDHRGKKGLSYRYNLLQQHKSVTKHYNGKHPRYFYGFQFVDEMLLEIFQDKLEKLARYGADRYTSYMIGNSMSNAGRRGFWSQCTLLH